MMNSLVEQVARAIIEDPLWAPHPCDQTQTPKPRWETATPRGIKESTRIAQAAITALRMLPDDAIAYIRENADLVNYPITDTVECLVDWALKEDDK
jgi:hypothetical protein